MVFGKHILSLLSMFCSFHNLYALLGTLKNSIAGIFQAAKQKRGFRFAPSFQALACLKTGGVSLPRTATLNFSRWPLVVVCCAPITRMTLGNLSVNETIKSHLSFE